MLESWYIIGFALWLRIPDSTPEYAESATVEWLNVTAAPNRDFFNKG